MTRVHPDSESAPEIHVHVVATGETHRFDRPATIGRLPSNDITVDDEFVSGEHAELRPTGDAWEIFDRASTNGTFIHGRRIDRASLGHVTNVMLGHGAGPELVLTVPALAPSEDRSPPQKDAIAERYLGQEDPADMSPRTRIVRAAFQRQRERDSLEHRKRVRRLRLAVVALLVAAVAAGGFAYVENRRAEAQRDAAAELFHVMKELELDIGRLETEVGASPSFRERRRRLERQYDELLATLGIYSEETPEEVRHVYRVVHRLGESEVNVPEAFVEEVLRYVERWKRGDLPRLIDRALRNDYASRIGATMLEHSLPPEFFYLALQESGFDTEAVGPPTRFGIAKGMWQFIPRTAEEYGLQPGPLRGEPRPDPRDERHDFETSTEAAARYLRDIYLTDAQASGLLVMASYNWGEHNVLRLIRSMPESPRERNFWKLLERHGERIPEQTYDYVLRIVAAAVIGEDPALFGFDFEPPLQGVRDPESA